MMCAWVSHARAGIRTLDWRGLKSGAAHSGALTFGAAGAAGAAGFLIFGFMLES
jgi:hypothetical protein